MAQPEEPGVDGRPGGPIVMVVDGSGSMAGERNIWARAVAMCLLHIARIEKRDFALVEFSSARQYATWQVPARKALDGQLVIEMLRTLAKAHGHTVIIVTHDNRIFHFADRIVQIEDGAVLESGQ